MKKRPLIVVLFALVCLLYPVLAVLQMLVTQPGGLVETGRNFIWPSKPLLFAAENLVATAVAWFAAFAVYQVKAWSWWIALVSSAALVAYGALVSMFRAQDVGGAWLVTSVLITALPLIATAVLLHREIRSPYFNPRVRWWESEARHPFDASLQGGGRALDISKRGMFVQHDEPPAQGTTDLFVLEVDGEEVGVRGNVSWVSQGNAAHPAGFGLVFDVTDSDNRKVIERLVSRQRKLGDKQWGERENRYASDIRCADGAFVLDISVGGMFVHSGVERRLGEQVEHQLLFGRHEFPVHGRVVWLSDGSGTYPRGYGLKFVQLDPDTRAMIRLAIDDLWKAGLEPIERQH